MSQPAIDVSQSYYCKSNTGIAGLDSILNGGIPTGRATLIAGAAGCGKSLIGQKIIASGARYAAEPGLIVTFEENRTEIIAGSKIIDDQFEDLCKQEQIVIDEINLPYPETNFQGDQSNLGGILARIEYHIKRFGVRRVLIDSIESLFSAFPSQEFIRREFRILVQQLKALKLTVIVTAERGEGLITRHGFEEYIADCVILCDHRIQNQLSTRRLRVVKYRGSSHSTDEFPFIITHRGIGILPITSLTLEYPASSVILKTGIVGLDELLGGGLYEGSSILVEGTAGTGKTSICATIAQHLCAAGKRVLYINFEESEAQLVRNLKSIGVDLQTEIDAERLFFHCFRPTAYGLESHLASIEEIFQRLLPNIVLLDPITSLINVGDSQQIYSMLCRLLDIFKLASATVILTSLKGTQKHAISESGISSVVDTWIDLNVQITAQKLQERQIRIVKARGLANLQQIGDFTISKTGLEIHI